jgi:hypothetical protein
LVHTRLVRLALTMADAPKQAESSAKPNQGMVQGVISSIFTPGVNSGLLTFVVIVFFVLFVVLVRFLLLCLTSDCLAVTDRV